MTVEVACVKMVEPIQENAAMGVIKRKEQEISQELQVKNITNKKLFYCINIFKLYESDRYVKQSKRTCWD